MIKNFRVAAVRVFVVFGFLVALASPLEFDDQNYCHIRNCTQNPRRGYNEGIFHCSIGDCSKQRQKDLGSSSYKDSSPILKRVYLYKHEQFAALNFTLSLPVIGTRTDLPATTAVRMDFWSPDDTSYSVCKSFNFSPQPASSAIPPREITYCGLTGLYQGTEEKRQTLYFLTLTAFPTGASITYLLIYQGWTFEEEARLHGAPAAVWKPLIAAAVRPGSGNIHMVVESPPQEFNVDAVEFALFCGKEEKDGGVPRKTVSRKLPKDEPFQLVYEFKDLPHEKCAVKVTPACANQSKCQESWSAWLPPDHPPVPLVSAHPIAVMIAVPVAACVALTVVIFIVYWRRRGQCKTQRSDPEVQDYIDLALVSNTVHGGCPQKELVDAFATLLKALRFSVTRIEENETASLQSHLQRAKVIVLLCLPRPNQQDCQEGWCPTLLNILGRDPSLQQKCILGCLGTRDSGQRACPHFPASRWAEEGEARENDAEKLLCSPPVFPDFALADMGGGEVDSFHEFYLGIHRKASSTCQPHTGYDRKDAWRDLMEKLRDCIQFPDERLDSVSVDSSVSSEHQSSSSSSDEEDDGSSSKDDQPSPDDSSSSEDDQPSPDSPLKHPAIVPFIANSRCEIGPGLHHQRQEDGGSGRVASSQPSFREGCVQGNHLSNHSVGEDHAGHRGFLPAQGWGGCTNCTGSAAHQGCQLRSPPCLAHRAAQAHTCCGQHHCGHFEPLGLTSDSGCPGSSVIYRRVSGVCNCQFYGPQIPAPPQNSWGNYYGHPHNGNFNSGHHHCGNAMNGTGMQGATRPGCPRPCPYCSEYSRCHRL